MWEQEEKTDVARKGRERITDVLTNLLPTQLHTPSIVKPNLRLFTQAVGLAFFVSIIPAGR